MKNTNLQLFKFRCDNKDCVFECFINRNNNILLHYSQEASALLDWKCPECGVGHLRYAPQNVRFIFGLIKEEKEKRLDNEDNSGKISEKFIDPND